MTSIDPSGVRIVRNDLSPEAQGFQRLGGIKTAEAVASLGPLYFDAKDILMVQGWCTTLSSGDTIGFQFNSDASAAYSFAPLYADPVTTSNVFTGSAAVSQPMLELHNDAGTTQTRFFFVTIANRVGMPKMAGWRMAKSTGSAATVGGLYAGVGQYYNLTANISSMTLRTATGTVTMGAGSGFSVFGKDI